MNTVYTIATDFNLRMFHVKDNPILNHSSRNEVLKKQHGTVRPYIMHHVNLFLFQNIPDI